MGNATALARANYGAGGPRPLTQLASRIKECELPRNATAAARLTPGRGDPIVDALSRFTTMASGGGPYSGRELGSRSRHTSPDVGMLAPDDGSSALGPALRSPSTSAFEGPLPKGRPWRFTQMEMIELVLDR